MHEQVARAIVVLIEFLLLLPHLCGAPPFEKEKQIYVDMAFIRLHAEANAHETCYSCVRDPTHTFASRACNRFSMVLSAEWRCQLSVRAVRVLL